MSKAHDFLMMGPVGTPLENFVFGTDTDDAGQFRLSKADARRFCALAEDSWFELDGEQWTIEEIFGTVYTFALDDVWETEARK
jgi:hypothetical protein